MLRLASWAGALALAWGLAAAPPAPAAEPPALQGLSGAAKERVAKLIEGAKKEGEVVVISNVFRPEPAQQIFEEFKKHYGLPDAKLSFTAKSSGAVIAAVKTDITSGRDTYDVVQVGSAVFFQDLHKGNALMKYDSPHYASYIPEVTGKAPGAVAKEGYYISGMSIVAGIVWNTKYVKKDIKTWEDILDPAYKGKIVITDVLQSATIISIYGGMRKVMPRSYFEQLAKQEPIFVVRSNTMLRQLASGEKWIAALMSTATGFQHEGKDAPVKAVVPPGGTVLLGYPFGILAKAPHPNMARLFIDYIHGPGHPQFIELQGYASGMKGLKVSPKIREFVPAIETLKVIPMDWERIGQKEIDAWRKEFREIFGESKQ
ncbi:MAG: extracellular solute-binding protein [Nitrospinota bacterium]